MFSEYYDRQGNPIDASTYSQYHMNPVYKVVKQTNCYDGKWISTVWLGLDHSFANRGTPVIFETMVFENRTHLKEIACKRYTNEQEALDGHEQFVQQYNREVLIEMRREKIR